VTRRDLNLETQLFGLGWHRRFAPRSRWLTLIALVAAGASLRARISRCSSIPRPAKSFGAHGRTSISSTPGPRSETTPGSCSPVFDPVRRRIVVIEAARYRLPLLLVAQLVPKVAIASPPHPVRLRPVSEGAGGVLVAFDRGQRRLGACSGTTRASTSATRCRQAARSSGSLRIPPPCPSCSAAKVAVMLAIIGHHRRVRRRQPRPGYLIIVPIDLDTPLRSPSRSSPRPGLRSTPLSRCSGMLILARPPRRPRPQVMTTPYVTVSGWAKSSDVVPLPRGHGARFCPRGASGDARLCPPTHWSRGDAGHRRHRGQRCLKTLSPGQVLRWAAEFPR
jgi:hypothetical protein